MTTGERRFSSASRTPDAGPEPLPAGEYELKILPGATVAKADGVGKVPYVNVSFEAENTAKSEGGKNRRVYHRFLLSLKPGKDGIVSADRGNGLTTFSKAVGSDLEAGLNEQQGESGESVEFINPPDVVEYLNSIEGKVVRAKVKIAKSEGYKDKNEVDRFLPSAH